LLAEKGPSAIVAVPALSKALSDQDLNVRWNAADALRAIGPGAEAAVPAGTGGSASISLRETNVSCRLEVLEGLLPFLL